MPVEEVSVTFRPAQKVVGPDAVMVAIGNGLTVTFTAAEVAEHPFAPVTVTEGELVVVTTIELVVAPVDHNQDAPADAVSVTEPPVQKLRGPEAVIVATGGEFTTTAVITEVA